MPNDWGSFVADQPSGCIDIANRALRVSIVSGGGSTANFADQEFPSGAINGVNVTYGLAHNPSPAGSLQLFLNGLMQNQGVDYTLAGSTITYASAPRSGDLLLAWYRY